MPEASLTPQDRAFVRLVLLRDLRRSLAKHYSLLAESASVPELPKDYDIHGNGTNEDWPGYSVPIHVYEYLMRYERERIDAMVIEIAERLRSK